MANASLKSSWSRLSALVGVERNATDHREKLISALGALLGILTVYWTSHWLDHVGLTLMVASMGASAVLLFAVPHGALSQPWPVIGGHVLSAVIGVSCQLLWPDHALTPALAVALAVGAMHYLGCIHPPGGATALAAVIGGPSIHALGYGYVWSPVLLNAGSLLIVAVLFNSLFPWRRYPALLAVRHPPEATVSHGLSHEDFAAAVQQMNSFIDVTPEDLEELFELASRHAEEAGPRPEQIGLGRCYSNGGFGKSWCVREVIDQAPRGHRSDQVIYKVVAGAGLHSTGVCRRDEFSRWARYEVVRQRELWVRAQRGDAGAERRSA